MDPFLSTYIVELATLNFVKADSQDRATEAGEEPSPPMLMPLMQSCREAKIGCGGELTESMYNIVLFEPNSLRASPHEVETPREVRPSPPSDTEPLQNTRDDTPSEVRT
jgi:uncharacterized membrane protein (UPF0182 family)